MASNSELSRRVRAGVGAVSVGMLVVLSTLVWQLVDSSLSRRKLVLEGNQASARIAGALVAAQLRNHLRAVEGIARRPDFEQLVAARDWTSVQFYLEAILAVHPQLGSAAVADADGKVWARYPVDPSIIGQDFSSRDYFRGAIISDGGYVSEVYEPEGTVKGSVVAFSVAVRDGSGKFLGVVQATLSVETFRLLGTETEVPNGGSIQIFDRAGHSVRQPVNEPLRSHLSNSLVKKALAGFSGVEESRMPGLDGIRLVAYVQVPEVGWAVMVEQSKSEALRPIAALRGRLAGAGALVLLVAIITTGIVIRLIRKLDNERTSSAAVLASALDAVVSIDHEGRITEFNPAAERMFGYRTKEVIGKTVAETIIPTGLPNLHGEGLNKGSLAETTARRSDGREFPVEVSVSKVDLPGTESLLGVIRDIGERKKAEEELNERESYKSALLASIAESVVTTDPDGHITSINPAMETLGGWAEAEVVGRLYADVYSIYDHSGRPVPLEKRVLSRAIKTRQRVASNGFDLMLITRDGRRVPIAITASPIIGNDGGMLGGVDIVRDVSADREVDQMKSALVSTVSHELRTPLTMIQGFSELLLTRKFDAKQSAEALQQINASSERLGRLIDDLLSVSRIESGKLAPRKEELNLSELIGEIAAQYVGVRTVRADIPRGLPSVTADRDMLVQILTNLVSNAVKYSPEAAPVEVTAAPNNGNIEISVTDRGFGITDQEMNNLFEKFYRVDRPEVQKVGGTGLGLFISRSLVEMQGGQIWVTSSAGKGSTFSFSLPVASHTAKEKVG